jgi:predicted O-methyltransferase YrrM
MKPEFTTDWMSQHRENWSKWLGKFVGCPSIMGLEIGTYEGRSAIWFAENILSGQASHLTCIEPKPQSRLEPNLRQMVDKITVIPLKAAQALTSGRFESECFSFVYIDGDHRASSVLLDAALSFPFLKVGGILIFDDYRWKSRTPNIPTTMPKIAIDAFLAVFSDCIRILGSGWQVAVEKISSP